jgi:hypothetical protein
MSWRAGLWGLAGLAVPASLALAALAIEVLRTPAGLTMDDGRFQASPMRQAGLWNVGSGSEVALGLDDDVTYRGLAGLYLKVEPGKVDYQGFPKLEALRAKVQFELTRMSREEPDPERRSRLLTLYGVMALDDRIVQPEERKTLLLKAVSAFRNAIELDPENTDAKTNLEAVLSAFGFRAIPGNLPGGAREGGPISGQGTSGTGY